MNSEYISYVHSAKLSLHGLQEQKIVVIIHGQARVSFRSTKYHNLTKAILKLDS